jgi:LmbE family N-acetylglucosaminyl deacetylase
MTNILILSPHTDDAELGCGGGIAKFVEEGHKILWVVLYEKNLNPKWLLVPL